MAEPSLLYSGPAITPNRRAVTLWGSTPGQPLVLFDVDDETVIGQADPSEIQPPTNEGRLTIGEWTLGPESLLLDLPSEPWKPLGSGDQPTDDLGGRVRVMHTTTRLVLIPRGPAGAPVDAVTIPLGRLVSIGQERIALTWWGGQLGFLSGSGCRPCEAATRKLIGVPL